MNNGCSLLEMTKFAKCVGMQLKCNADVVATRGMLLLLLEVCNYITA